ncbi:hypothetical protein [Yersinia mollaretii]|uniref:hypothetical protein n=1 Tax=Yersinia mollaretii TaxID=33060 RepID=UPI000A6710F0|nr:hypothetical protein [Yersinia mollaretii]
MWLHRRAHPARALAACQLALKRHLPAQIEQIATLLLRYGTRTKISRKVVEAYKQHIKLLERDKAQSHQ